jgi:type 1 fimbria pilin
MKYLIGLFMSVLILTTGLANAAFGQTNGSIQFSGVIVEEPCYVFENQNNLIGRCTRNTEVKSVNISTKNISSKKEVALPYSMGKMSVVPVSNSPKSAMVTITYL